MRIDNGNGRNLLNISVLIIVAIGTTLIWNASDVSNPLLPAGIILFCVIAMYVFYKKMTREIPPEDRSRFVMTSRNTLLWFSACGVTAASLGYLLRVVFGSA